MIDPDMNFVVRDCSFDRVITFAVVFRAELLPVRFKSGSEAATHLRELVALTFGTKQLVETVEDTEGLAIA